MVSFVRDLFNELNINTLLLMPTDSQGGGWVDASRLKPMTETPESVVCKVLSLFRSVQQKHFDHDEGKLWFGSEVAVNFNSIESDHRLLPTMNKYPNVFAHIFLIRLLLVSL